MSFPRPDTITPECALTTLRLSFGNSPPRTCTQGRPRNSSCFTSLPESALRAPHQFLGVIQKYQERAHNEETHHRKLMAPCGQIFPFFFLFCNKALWGTFVLRRSDHPNKGSWWKTITTISMCVHQAFAFVTFLRTCRTVWDCPNERLWGMFNRNGGSICLLANSMARGICNSCLLPAFILAHGLALLCKVPFPISPFLSLSLSLSLYSLSLSLSLSLYVLSFFFFLSLSLSLALSLSLYVLSLSLSLSFYFMFLCHFPS